MSNLFEALKNLEKRHGQVENPFANRPDAQLSTNNGITHSLKHFLSKPYGISIIAITVIVLIGFITLLAMDWYLKKTPMQLNSPISQKQLQASSADSSQETLSTTKNDQMKSKVSHSAPKANTKLIQNDKAALDSYIQQSSTATATTTLEKKSEQLDIAIPHSISIEEKNNSNKNIGNTKEIANLTEIKLQKTKAESNKSKEIAGQYQEANTLSEIPNQPIKTPINIQITENESIKWQKSLLEQAEMLRKNKQFNEAVSIYKKLWIATHDPGVANNLAAAYIAMGEPYNAIEILKEAMEIAPKDEDIKYNMEIAQHMVQMQQ